MRLAALALAGTIGMSRPHAGLAQSPVADTVSLRKEISQRLGDLLAAFRRNDPHAMTEVFTPDARLIGPGGLLVTGRAAIDSYWVARPRPRSWTMEVLEVGGGREAPWQLGRSIRISDAAGRPDTSIVTFLLAWKRGSDGRLRIHLDLWS